MGVLRSHVLSFTPRAEQSKPHLWSRGWGPESLDPMVAKPSTGVDKLTGILALQLGGSREGVCRAPTCPLQQGWSADAAGPPVEGLAPGKRREREWKKQQIKTFLHPLTRCPGRWAGAWQGVP